MSGLGAAMLRIEFAKYEDTLMMCIEGRFVNRFAENARSLILSSEVPPRLVVNLSEVTFVDAAGEDVLSWFNHIGALFVATTCYSISVCEQLHLRTTQKNFTKRQKKTFVDDFSLGLHR
jgi:uracil-DNA glycosylase